MKLDYFKTLLIYLAIVGAGIAVSYVTVRALRPSMSKSLPIQVGDYSSYFKSAGASVVIFGRATCRFCSDAREYMDKRKVTFAYVDIVESAQAADEFERLGAASVPVVLIGNRMITGFNPVALDDALDGQFAQLEVPTK